MSPHLFLHRKIRVDYGDDKLTVWLQVPFELGIISRADVTWNYYNDYTNPYSYCLWECNSSLYISSIKLTDVSKKYVKLMLISYCSF